jgi:hypothetical protein
LLIPVAWDHFTVALQHQPIGGGAMPAIVASAVINVHQIVHGKVIVALVQMRVGN